MAEESSNTGPRDCTLDNKVPKNNENSCIWWINSPTNGYCFWAYVKDKSGPDGSMPELVQSEIATLMNWSNTKTHFMLKEAMEELINALKSNNARQLLNEETDPIVDFLSYNLEASSYIPEDPEE